MAHNDYDPETGLPLLPVMPKVSKLKEPERLPQPIAPEDLERIITASPRHLADAIRLTAVISIPIIAAFGFPIPKPRPKEMNSFQPAIWRLGF